MPLSQTLLQHLSQTLGAAIKPADCRPVTGGSINEVYCIVTGSRKYCCKLNSATKFPHLFEGEAAGLQQLSPHTAVPQVISYFQVEQQQALLMEWIEEGQPDNAFWKTFGEQLAKLHSVTAKQFGAANNNYMGAVPQSNQRHDAWNTFFAQERIMPLVAKCVQHALLTKEDVYLFEQLVARLPIFFDEVRPALVHGDLWSGNFICANSGQPVLIDPAVYYGHPSVDLGLTTLFGGFDKAFYEAYHYHAPLPANYKDQWAICNLYPLLIHLLLFGKSYLSRIRQTLQQYV